MEMTTPESPFLKLRGINVNAKTEKKGNLTYLSWAWAVDQLLTADCNANWTYLDPLMFGDTMMVRCAVTAFGITRTAQLPVMNHKNQPIAKPDAFQVNTAMQRCLAKGIALHGLGLYIYAGEDVPPDDSVTDQPEPEKTAPQNTPTQIMRDEFDALPKDLQHQFSVKVDIVRAHLDSGNVEKGYEVYAEFRDSLEDTAHKAALRSLFNPAERSALQRENKRLTDLKVAA